MDLQFESKFTRLKVGVGVNLWSEFVDDEKKSVREQARLGLSHPLNPQTTMGLGGGEVVIDTYFWKIELEEPALLILSRSVGRPPLVGQLGPSPFMQEVVP